MRRSLIISTVAVSLLAACGEATDSNGAAGTEAAGAASTEDDPANLVTTTDDSAIGDAAADDSAADTSAADTTTTTNPTALSVSASPMAGWVLVSGSESGDLSQLLAALEKTGDFTSARMEGWITIVGGTGRSGGTAETMSFSGAYDVATTSSMSLVDFSQLAAGMPGSAKLSPEMAETIGELEIRTIGETAYMRIELLASLGFPTPWVSMPAADVSELAEGFGVNIADPRGMLGVFALADAEVEQIGHERVDGADTTHFRISIDVDTMLALAGPEAADRLRATGGFPPQGALPIDMWIGDDDGFVHRFSYTVDGTAHPESDFESIELGWEIFDYGDPIEIIAPPADQVTDGGSLLELAAGA